jgi:ATP-dependent RNA helicase DeaD
MARALVAQRSPEEIAAALVRFYRARLPAPEELFDGGPASRDGRTPRARNERAPGRNGPEERGLGGKGMALFRMSVGRRNNADPRWLVPIICRRGHVTKSEIGLIRVFDWETQFEIAEPIAARFAAAVRRTSDDQDIRIEPAGAGPSAVKDRQARGHKPPADQPPQAGKPAGKSGKSDPGGKVHGSRASRQRPRT